MSGAADPLQLLLAYDPGVVTTSTQGEALEVHSNQKAAADGYFAEIRGGGDTYYEDFSEGLQEYAAAYRKNNSSDLWVGGGADPSAFVAGVDWMEEAEDDAAAAAEEECSCRETAPGDPGAGAPSSAVVSLASLIIADDANDDDNDDDNDDYDDDDNNDANDDDNDEADDDTNDDASEKITSLADIIVKE